MNIPKAVIDQVATSAQQKLDRREQTYRIGRPASQLADRLVILVDDGLGTGASMSAAVAGPRTQHPAPIVVAVPTAAPKTCEQFETRVDRVVCGETPQPFFGVGFWYENFSQTTDDEVRALLEAAQQIPHAERS
ncbi:MAG: hypothetical protein KDE19_06025 [Caldilineaceae bacterium]|nr:hypothetical protein [Caldilineaceae bacterium]